MWSTWHCPVAKTPVSWFETKHWNYSTCRYWQTKFKPMWWDKIFWKWMKRCNRWSGFKSLHSEDFCRDISFQILIRASETGRGLLAPTYIRAAFSGYDLLLGILCHFINSSYCDYHFSSHWNINRAQALKITPLRWKTDTQWNLVGLFCISDYRILNTCTELNANICIFIWTINFTRQSERLPSSW